MKPVILFLFVILIAACQSRRSEEANTSVYWVNSLKVNCSGVGPTTCLQVQKGDEIDPDAWKMFYANIEDFEFEPGYVYKLEVSEEQLPPDQVPADASSIRYKLIEMIEKNEDPSVKLHDVWVLEEIESEPIDMSKLKEAPRMEISLTDKKVMGFDGCNNFNGRIERVGEGTLDFGPIAGTRKMCMDMTVPDRFGKLMNRVEGYRMENTTLYLQDGNQNDLLTFKKAD